MNKTELKNKLKLSKLSKNVFLLFLALCFFCFSGCINEGLSSDLPDNTYLVTKIIDGDTVIVQGGATIRLLGIDTDERNYPCYEQAKSRIEELILNQEVYLESDQEDKDQYDRYLRYILLNGENINLQLVEEGLAIARFSSGNTKYQQEIKTAEETAMQGRFGCKWKDIDQTNNQEDGLMPMSTTVEFQKLTEENTQLIIIPTCQAKQYLKKQIIVQGKIEDSYLLKDKAVFLNLGGKYPDHCFTAVIWSDAWNSFPLNPNEYYLNKVVRISGIVEEYNGKPQIILKNMQQIEIGE